MDIEFDFALGSVVVSGMVEPSVENSRAWVEEVAQEKKGKILVDERMKGENSSIRFTA